MFQMDEGRTATLDLKNRKPRRPGPNTPVPFADVEDDRNLSAIEPVSYGNGTDVRKFTPLTSSNLAPFSHFSKMGHSMSNQHTLE